MTTNSKYRTKYPEPFISRDEPWPVIVLVGVAVLVTIIFWLALSGKIA